MDKVYLLFRTDEHLSNFSKELLFAGNSVESCITATKRFGATQLQLRQLRAMRQSQCTDSEEEYMIEEHNVNEFVVSPNL